ncbi:kinase-like protein [Aspergillus sclerotioniger CBS 115572]|uniref:Kinase-like protein n=1 Tax=Aspergillus sclerotioniger CBS 115572 TaxID=1450535 RepID=A0A317XCD7_9EURO|nr:kinase-like protein [Aspergillus sclerotioniger CBS 115572]PWY95277.1 kinase-like protein [Aspergillus sclerotioniger CBS 115572]
MTTILTIPTRISTRPSLLPRLIPSILHPPLSCHVRQYTRNLLYTSRAEPLEPGTTVTSDTNQTYKIEEVLFHAEKTTLHRPNQTIHPQEPNPGEFDYQRDIHNQLSPYPNIRTVIDTIQESETFIYPILKTNLLQFPQKNLSQATRKQILRSALQGLVDMHANNIHQTQQHPHRLHSPGNHRPRNHHYNPSPDRRSGGLSDHPPGKWIKGPLCGNAMWRSPESWARASQDQASDVFSFALVIIYVMHKHMPFYIPGVELNTEDAWRHILPLHLSYFADIDGLELFLGHIGEDNPYFQCMLELVSTFGPENPIKPIRRWTVLEPELRDLVERMARLDPRRRITAEEALEHPWFGDC